MTESDDKATNAIREAAAEWVVRLSGANVTHADKSTFARWLRRSPVHVKEYLRAEAAWLEMDGAAQGDSSDIASLLKSDQDNVVELHRVEHRREEQIAPSQDSLADEGQSASGQRVASDPTGLPAEAVAREVVSRPAARLGRRRFAAAAIAATLVLGFGVMLVPWLVERLDPGIYATGVGEQRRVMLADGSAMELNTGSKVRVRITDALREVHLMEGEAFFIVAKDSSRPFRVLSDTAIVRAIGTQFNVYRQPDKTVVTVIEGRVAVMQRAEGSSADPADSADDVSVSPAAELAPIPVEVSAGSSVQIAPGSAVRPSATKPGSTIAWRQRRVVFEDETLANVVAEFNRYNTRQLVIEDPRLAAVRVSGVFDPTEPGDLVGFLTQSGDARVSESESSIVLSIPD